MAGDDDAPVMVCIGVFVFIAQFSAMVMANLLLQPVPLGCDAGQTLEGKYCYDPVNRTFIPAFEVEDPMDRTAMLKAVAGLLIVAVALNIYAFFILLMNACFDLFL